MADPQTDASPGRQFQRGRFGSLGLQRRDGFGPRGRWEPGGKYSFRRPFAAVEVIDEAGAHTLTIAKDADDKYYAKSSDLEGVYEVSSTLPEALDKPLEDFRNKKLFDFGFVDPEAVQLRDSDTRLTIAKQEDKWVLASDEDRELDAEKVQTMLDALRGLSVKEFTSDESADQTKFGLEAPTIETEVVQASGGGTEQVVISDPSSDQVYAAIPGQASTYEIEKGDIEELRTSISDLAKPEEEEEEAERGRRVGILDPLLSLLAGNGSANVQ